MEATISRSAHMRKIILHSLLVAVPMLASSTIIIYIVYANLVNQQCPNEGLCPRSINATSADHYLIDFPAARLAFISSGSATVSFTLLGVLMTMYSYINAASFLRSYQQNHDRSMQTSDQMSAMIRLLNAEMTVLWDVVSSSFKGVFWDLEKDDNTPSPSPNLTRSCYAVLSIGIVASLLVQAADVYFHITAEAAQVVQFEAATQSIHDFSRGLAPWCLNKPRFGDIGEEKIWGCAITAQRATYNNATSLAATNASTISDMKNGVSDQHKTVIFTDASDVQFAIVGPANDDPSLDWKASSFGVSTTCSAIPQTNCNASVPIKGAIDGNNNPIMLVPFNCTRTRAGPAVVGNLTSQNTVTHMTHFHKYTSEGALFFGNKLVRNNVSLPDEGVQDGDDVFNNGWSVLAMRKIPSAVQGDFSQLPGSFVTDERIWKHDLLGAFVLMDCNVTVWDLTYTSSDSEISLTSKSLSNGTVAGTASMPGTRQLGILANIFQDESTGPLSRSSPENFIRSFEIGMSKAYSYSLASQMSSRPSILVQRRITKVVTRLPVTALWLLVAANMLYALIGWIIAVCAMLKVSKEVGRVQKELSVDGLVQALFAREKEQEATSEHFVETRNKLDDTTITSVVVVEQKGMAI